MDKDITYLAFLLDEDKKTTIIQLRIKSRKYFYTLRVIGKMKVITDIEGSDITIKFNNFNIEITGNTVVIDYYDSVTIIHITPKEKKKILKDIDNKIKS